MVILQAAALFGVYGFGVLSRNDRMGHKAYP